MKNLVLTRFLLCRRFLANARNDIFRGFSTLSTMAETDKFVGISGTKILILSRVFGFTLFEIISYAAGLTAMNFRKYFLITAIFSAIPATIFGFVFKNANLQSAATLFFWIATLIITGTIFAFFIKKFIAKNKGINKH